MICRRIAALALILILLLSACGPAAVAPNPSGGTAALPAAAEPARAVIQDSFTVALPLPANSDDKEAYRAHLQRLQNLLRGKGWNVTLAEVPLPEGQTYEDYAQEFVDLVRKMAASGKGPDAWRVSPDMAQRLRPQGLTQDMAAVMPAASALLWDLCKGAFTDGADGVPVSLTAIPKGLPVLLVMDTAAVQAYGSPITDVDDILTLLEKQPDVSLWTDFSGTVTDAWAAQQGYYPLAYFGLPPFLYARMDDANCTPVPVEDIEGFDGFFRRWTALWVNGRWGTPGSDARMYSGILSGSGYSPRSLQRLLGLQGDDVVALPLAGCTQLPPADPPVCLYLLAVPTASQQAATVAAFAQWMLLDRQGYDLCEYGQQDVDYRLEDERVESLKSGQPLSVADWGFDSKNPAAPFYQYMGSISFYSKMMRIQKGSPANLEQVLAACKVETPPLWRVKALRKPNSYLQDTFDIRQPYGDALNQHTQDVCYAVNLVNGVPDRTADQVLRQLRNNRPKLDPLIQDLKERLRQMLDNPDSNLAQTAQP